MEPQGAPNENTTYNRYKADHTTSLIWHVLACLPTCPSLLRVPILATLAGIAVEATLGLDVKVVTLLSNGLHDALHSHALNTTELKPLWHMVWTSLGKLFDTVIHVTGDKSETFFTHIALCLYLGGPNSSVILNDRYIPLLLETPRIHWDTIFPSAINALLIQWYSRIIITSPDHIFALTEGIMRLVSHAAARSTPVLLASATTIMSFSIRTNNKPLATRLLQAVVPARRAHGRLDFDFLSTVLLPLTTMMCTGGWSLTEDSLAPFWKQTIEHFGPALDKLQRGSDWMVVAQSLTYGNFGCGRHECNASILDEASGSDRFNASELQAFEVWLSARGHILRFFNFITNALLRQRILGSSHNKICDLLFFEIDCPYCDETESPYGDADHESAAQPNTTTPPVSRPSSPTPSTEDSVPTLSSSSSEEEEPTLPTPIPHQGSFSAHSPKPVFGLYDQTPDSPTPIFTPGVKRALLLDHLEAAYLQFQRAKKARFHDAAGRSDECTTSESDATYEEQSEQTSEESEEDDTDSSDQNMEVEESEKRREMSEDYQTFKTPPRLNKRDPLARSGTPGESMDRSSPTDVPESMRAVHVPAHLLSASRKAFMEWARASYPFN